MLSDEVAIAPMASGLNFRFARPEFREQLPRTGLLAHPIGASAMCPGTLIE